MSIQHEQKGKQPVSAAISVVAEAEEPPVCWICLDGPQPEKPLTHPCRCPSFCHASCIARWQLQSAGTRREKYCDFCSGQLPDWKSVLTPNGNTSAPAVMNVNFDNKTYSFQVSPGADGYRQFTEAIRKAFHLPEDSELNITFTCDEPSTAGALLTLSGPGAYDAAVHCASVSAARRSSLSSDAAPGSPSSSSGPLNGSEGPGSRNGRRSTSSDCQQPPFDARLPAHRAAAAASERGPPGGSSAGSAGGAVGAAGGAPLRPLTPVSSFLAASHSSRQLQLLERQPSGHQYGCDEDHNHQQQRQHRRRHSSPGRQQHQEGGEDRSAGNLSSHWVSHSSSESLGAASAASSSGSLLVRTADSPHSRVAGVSGVACPSPANSDSTTYAGGANTSSSSSASSSRASSPRVTLGRTGSADTTTSATSSRGIRSPFAGAGGNGGEGGGNASAGGSGSSGLGGQRRGSGFGRKLRNALSDLLIIK